MGSRGVVHFFLHDTSDFALRENKKYVIGIGVKNSSSGAEVGARR